MDPFRNPFAPGAGSSPPELAGRGDILDVAKLSCRRAVAGRSARSLMLLGLRGTGKTVLLGEIETIGQSNGLLVSRIEAPEGESLARLLLPEMRKVMRSVSNVEAARQLAERARRGLRGFAAALRISVAEIDIAVVPEPGLADSGDIVSDLPDLFEAIGIAAKAAGKGWLLLVDEVQYLSEPDLSALIVALHRTAQRGLPVVFAGAGLPQVARLAGDAKSSAERLFHYLAVDALMPEPAARAIRKPIEDEGASIDDDALALIVAQTAGYPFFLQEWGASVWDVAEADRVCLRDAEISYGLALQSLDEGFFKVRVDRLTRAETALVVAMAGLGDGPYPMASIAAALGRTQSSLGPTRANVIRKGMIWSTEHGYLDFTVPLFADYMRRRQAAPDPSA